MFQSPATIRDGNLFFGKDKLRDWARSQKDGPYIIRVKKKRNIRSLPQNNYYWGVIIQAIADETGADTIDEYHQIHEALKANFLGTVEANGIKVPKSTSDLSIDEFMEYIERIKRWAAEFLNGLTFPENEGDKNEQD